MHELNNPGTAAVRAASQLRENLMRMHKLTARFSKANLSDQQKDCMIWLQDYALAKEQPVRMNSLEQSDAEEALAEWMESAEIEDAWKLAPTLVSIGITSGDLECARSEFPGPFFSDALNWLEALVSSMALVSTIEESIGRVSNLVKAVKSYAYEGKGQKQSVDINESIHATLVILTHKFREKQITLQKDVRRQTFPSCSASAPGSTRSGPTSSIMPSTPWTPAATSASAPGRRKPPPTPPSPTPAAPLPLHQHRRRRRRHPAGEPAPHLRPLLHHQSRRRRHRPRPRHRPAYRPAVRRHRHLLLRARQHRVPHPPPPRPRLTGLHYRKPEISFLSPLRSH